MLRRLTTHRGETMQHSFNVKVNYTSEKCDLHAPLQPDTSSQNLNQHESSSSNLNDVESSSDDDVVPGSFPDRCIDELKSSNILRKVVYKFNKEGLLSHFMAFMKLTSSGTLPVTNISTLLNMELSKLKSLQNSTQMRYREDTCLFWETVLSIGGPRLLRLFSSDKHFGQVNSGAVEKSKYNPLLGNNNFAVPDERILRKSKTFVDKEIPCGIIDEAVQLLQQNKQYIVSLDGKQAGLGLRTDGYGDVNLWGYEGPPTLSQMQHRLREETDFVLKVSDCAEYDVSVLDKRSVLWNLKFIVQLLSNRIKALRQAKVRHELLRSSFQQTIKKFPEKRGKYDMAFSEIDAFVCRADNVIDKILKHNIEWCHLMARINECENAFKSKSPLDLANQGNLQMLLEPDVVEMLQPGHLVNNSDHVKQRTQYWYRLRANVRVTGSTIHNALGLRTLIAQKKHYDEYISMKPNNDPPTAAMIHGTQNEVICETLFNLIQSNVTKFILINII